MQSRSTKVAELSPEASGCCVRCRVVAVIVAAQMGSGEAEAVSCSEVLVGDVSANPHTRDLPRQNPDCPLRTPTAAPCLYVRLCWQRSDVMYRWCTAPGGVPFSKLHQLALTPGAVFKWLGSFRELAWHQHVAYNWATWQETGCISMMLVGDQMELLLPGRSAPGYLGCPIWRARALFRFKVHGCVPLTQHFNQRILRDPLRLRAELHGGHASCKSFPPLLVGRRNDAPFSLGRSFEAENCSVDIFHKRLRLSVGRWGLNRSPEP
jgi:hypothetical protein